MNKISEIYFHRIESFCELLFLLQLVQYPCVEAINKGFCTPSSPFMLNDCMHDEKEPTKNIHLIVDGC